MYNYGKTTIISGHVFSAWRCFDSTAKVNLYNNQGMKLQGNVNEISQIFLVHVYQTMILERINVLTIWSNT